MDNIIEISKNIEKIIKKHKIKNKEYSFMIKSFPHTFILTIWIYEFTAKKQEAILNDLNLLDGDVSNGRDTFQTHLQNIDHEHIFFSGQLL